MRFLSLICCLMVGSVAAEMIGTVEYQLPEQNKSWKVDLDMQGNANDPKKSTTKIYVPQNATKEDAKETFGVVEVDLPSQEINQAAIEKMYAEQFPSLKAKVTILEKDSNSVTYEWSLSKDGKEEVHGWTRIFSGADQTVLLTYQTEELDKLKDVGPLWSKTLKQAKMTSKEEKKSATEEVKSLTTKP